MVYRFWHSRSAKGRVGYIGKDKHHPRRFDLTRRAKDSACRKLYRALKKYPAKIWRKEILASGFRTDAALTKAEIFHIAKVDSKRKGYNCTDGGGGLLNPSAETRARMSQAMKGENNPFWGKTHSAETLAKLRILNARKGENNPNWGKILSAEHRAKLSESHKGKKFSAETRARMSKAQKVRRMKEITS